ncbi:chemokine (C-X-C motif) ligand 18a, duplicate 1 [Sardina pilchardus]|uniref:chemokine (C-X-C motif) ligand 18a, duplicate 1 n=1 Tax=Sardina pilchardus TaxID=27697 RepID=UPI002E0D589F
MARQSVLPVLLLLILQGHWTQWTEPGVGATAVPDGCVCVKEVPFVPWRTVSNLSIVLDNPLCRTHIIITQKKKGDVCLNPDSDQGKRLQKCWKKFSKYTYRKRARNCLRPRNLRPEAKKKKTKAH